MHPRTFRILVVALGAVIVLFIAVPFAFRIRPIHHTAGEFYDPTPTDQSRESGSFDEELRRFRSTSSVPQASPGPDSAGAGDPADTGRPEGAAGSNGPGNRGGDPGTGNRVSPKVEAVPGGRDLVTSATGVPTVPDAFCGAHAEVFKVLEKDGANLFGNTDKFRSNVSAFLIERPDLVESLEAATPEDKRGTVIVLIDTLRSWQLGQATLGAAQYQYLHYYVELASACDRR